MRTLSPRGLSLLKTFEGLRLEAYLCPAKVWTIGYGETLGVKPGMKITEKEAEELLVRSLYKYVRTVNVAVKVPITQSEFDALVLLCYNIGIGSVVKDTGFLGSTVLARLNANDKEGAARAFLMWNKVNGKVSNGLHLRRQKERALFESADAIS